MTKVKSLPLRTIVFSHSSSVGIIAYKIYYSLPPSLPLFLPPPFPLVSMFCCVSIYIYMCACIYMNIYVQLNICLYHLIASGIISYPENYLSQNILLPQSFSVSKWLKPQGTLKNKSENKHIFINDLEAIREDMIVVNNIESLYIRCCPSHSNLRTML